MPFWWNRRRKPWFTTWRKRRYFKTRRRRKTRPRRRYRRPYSRRRRRRRRRYKVRKKLQKITVKQWQPDSIVKCKIKGLGCLVAGAQGRQPYYYTTSKYQYPQPKAPGGGGFGAELFSLQYLYEEWVARRNIWTRSNDYKDLVRFTGCTFYLFRHTTTDFIFNYSRQPPFLLEKDYFNDLQPMSMLLSRHHRTIPSLSRKPLGKPYIKVKIKPPKQMLTKWFFQQDFATQGLFTISASAANLSWAYYNPDTQSRCLTLYSLNTTFYANADYGAAATHPWFPYNTWPHTTGLKFCRKVNNKWVSKTVKPTTYSESISYTEGFFQPAVLQATKIVAANITDDKIEQSPAAMASLPIAAFRYNPEEDTGQGNVVWLTSILTNSHWEQPQLTDLIIVGKPLWQAFYGFQSYIEKTKKYKDWLISGIFVCKCPSLKRLSTTTQTTFIFVDLDFIQGKLPYEETITDKRKQFWYPVTENQQTSIAALVQCGPYVPKYAYQDRSTWELTYKYIFHFKWGGPYVSEELVQNPKNQGKYPVPDTISQAIQVANPLKQTFKTMLRDWDYRRGIVTTTALKRMSKHLETDSSLQSDDSETPKKKKKITAEIPCHEEKTQEIQQCLLSLFEESTCQETEDLKQLIQHQQQQQQKLKLNLIKLLMDLKHQQRILQHQTGID
uniref:Capsid protein n=1 Tax=Gammatorquevirus homidi8 TaxID=3048393 RepID=A0AAU7ST52_9VIRU